MVSEITLGERTKTLREGAIAIHGVRYPPHRHFPPHAHDRPNLTFVLAGSMEESVGGRRRTFTACDAVLKPAHTVHSNHCGGTGARSLVIEITTASAPALTYAHLQGIEVIQLARRAAEALNLPARLMREEVDEIIIEAIALPEHSPVESTVRSRAVRRACDLLHDGFAHPLRVADLARLVDLHPVYLARVFRRQRGCSVSEYRRRLQVSAAARMLADGEVPVAGVALRCGFADQSHLCRAFRECCGSTPAAFRRAMATS